MSSSLPVSEHWSPRRLPPPRPRSRGPHRRLLGSPAAIPCALARLRRPQTWRDRRHAPRRRARGAPRTGPPSPATIERIILPGLTHWQSPSFFGYFPANISPPAVIGELLSAGLGVQGMMWSTSPACTEVETRMLDWMARAIGLPQQFLLHQPPRRRRHPGHRQRSHAGRHARGTLARAQRLASKARGSSPTLDAGPLVGDQGGHDRRHLPRWPDPWRPRRRGVGDFGGVRLIGTDAAHRLRPEPSTTRFAPTAPAG